MDDPWRCGFKARVQKTRFQTKTKFKQTSINCLSALHKREAAREALESAKEDEGSLCTTESFTHLFGDTVEGANVDLADVKRYESGI